MLIYTISVYKFQHGIDPDLIKIQLTGQIQVLLESRDTEFTQTTIDAKPLSLNLSDRHITGIAILPAIFSGLLFTASFPDIGYHWMAWFAFFPLLFAARQRPIRQAFLIGFIAGFTHYTTLLYWLVPTMNGYGHIPIALCVVLLFLLAGYLALHVALFTVVFSCFRTARLLLLIIIPVSWVSVEYLRTILFTGFPWELLGYSQFNVLPIIQISDITGVYGVSFLVALVNAALFLVGLCLAGDARAGTTPVSRTTAALSVGISALALGLVIAYGYVRINKIDYFRSVAKKTNIAVVQGNVDQSLKWETFYQLATINKYLGLSFNASEDNPDLIVWPETATPFYFLHKYEKKFTAIVQHGIQKAGTWFLIGSPASIAECGAIKYMNSAYLVDPEGRQADRYDKVHLVPYGEYVPLRQWFPFVDKLVAGIGDFSSGEKGSTIAWNGLKLGPQICFEIIFPDLARAAVQNGAAILVNITNDAWFGRTSAPYQHLSMTVFRAVENRKALVRCANTGISCFVGPAGRITAPTSLYTDAVVTQPVPVMKTEPTFYTRLGDLFALLCAAAALLLMGLNRFKAR